MKLLMLLVIAACLAIPASAETVPGLKYSYYEGKWNSLPDFNALKPIKEGVVKNVNLEPRNRETDYAILWTGYINILTAGNYTFETLSDDGSKFYIGNSGWSLASLVNNDGLHAPQLRTGTIFLKVGVYPVAVSYLQQGGGQTMELYWSSNTGIPWGKIPDNAFYSNLEDATFTSRTLGLNYSYYEGNWSTLPDFKLLTAIKRGLGYNANLNPRNRETDYAIEWIGYIKIPAAGNYTFEILSDDGSKFMIGEHAFNLQTLIDNDGLHGPQARSGTIFLDEGVYPVNISYFQQGGGQTMELFWSSNTGINHEKIPDNVFIANLEGVHYLYDQVPGLNYSYYEGSWSTLPDFGAIAPIKQGRTGNTSLSIRSREQEYAILWRGYIKIPQAGEYTFETFSDDGSALYIGDYNNKVKPLVDNDGLHAMQGRSGKVNLTAGIYPITISFFQNGGGQTFLVYWSSNSGINHQLIPDNVFLSETKSTLNGQPTETENPEEPKPPVIADNPDETGGLTGNTNYYFSTSAGDDSRTSLEAQNPETPWKTVNKLNGFFSSLQPGDAVLFKRGEIFDGGITVKQSGKAGQSIILSAYGNGRKPVISGFSNLANWEYLGNGIWQSDCQTTGSVNMVTMNGVVQAMGRYPNFTDANKGYLVLEAHSGTTRFTDNELTAATNWTGAEVVIRKNDWVLDRCLITAHGGNSITYVSPTGHEPTDGYGYFIQNSPKTLDKTGEWYFDPQQKKMIMYFGTSNPNFIDVKAGVKDKLVSSEYFGYYTLDNLSFHGADEVAIGILYGSDIKIQNCEIDKTGVDAIYVEHSPRLKIENNVINHSNNSGIRVFHGTTHALIKGNIVKNSGLLHGMGKSNNQQMDGIFVDSGPSNIIELNRVDSSGYCGITFTGDSTIIRKNFINTFCLTVNDGGGIYTWGGFDKVGRIIESNIILNGKGSAEGTNNPVPGGAVGIYTDDRSAALDIIGNTVAHCSRAGIYLHNSHEISLRSNTLYDNETQLNMVHDGLEVHDPIRNIRSILKNTFFSKRTNQYIIGCGSRSDDFQFFGTFNDNDYARPMDKNGIITLNYTSERGDPHYSFYDLKGWQNKYKYDLNSSESPVEIPAFKVSKLIGSNKFSNGKFDSNTNGAFCIGAPGKATASWVSDGKIDGGAMQISFDAPGTDLNNVGTYFNLGPTQAGKTYVIKFSLLSPNVGKTLKGFLLDGNNYARLSPTKYFELTNRRINHEFLFTATTSSNNALLAFEIFGKDLPFVIDNFETFEAEVLINDPNDFFRFEYNATENNRTITFDGTYIDVKNRSYLNEVTLAPFSSVILIKQAALQSQINVTHQQTAVDIKAPAGRSVKISPNPAGSSVQISIRGFEQQHATLSLYTVSGIKLKTVPVTVSDQPLSLDVSSLTGGTYYIQLNINGTIVNEKFVKL